MALNNSGPCISQKSWIVVGAYARVLSIPQFGWSGPVSAAGLRRIHSISSSADEAAEPFRIPGVRNGSGLFLSVRAVHQLLHSSSDHCDHSRAVGSSPLSQPEISIEGHNCKRSCGMHASRHDDRERWHGAQKCSSQPSSVRLLFGTRVLEQKDGTFSKNDFRQIQDEAIPKRPP